MEFYIEHIYPLLRWPARLSPLLPFLIGIWYYRKQKCTQFRLLLLFITVGVLTEVAATTVVMLGYNNNQWVAQLYTLLGFGVLAGVFYHSFVSSMIKKAILVSIVGLLLIMYYDVILTDGITKINSLSRVAANAMLILMAIAYFYKVANNAKVIYLDRDPMFLLSCAVLIYYAGTSMSYAIFNEALAISYDTARVCLSIIMVLNIIFYASSAFILRRMVA